MKHLPNCRIIFGFLGSEIKKIYYFEQVNYIFIHCVPDWCCIRAIQSVKYGQYFSGFYDNFRTAVTFINCFLVFEIIAKNKNGVFLTNSPPYISNLTTYGILVQPFYVYFYDLNDKNQGKKISF